MVVFSFSSAVNTILLGSICMKLASSLVRVGQCSPVNRQRSMVFFVVRVLRSSSNAGPRVLRYCSTTPISQMLL